MNGSYPIRGGQHLKLDSINPRVVLVKCQILLLLLSIWLVRLGRSLGVVVQVGVVLHTVDKSLLRSRMIQLLDPDSFDGLYYHVLGLMDL
jgi:ABC-type enterochelin transport system permease subunit